MILHIGGGRLKGWVRPEVTGDPEKDEVICALWLSLSIYNPDLIVTDITERSHWCARFISLAENAGLSCITRLKGIALTGRVKSVAADMSEMPHLMPILTALCARSTDACCISMEKPGNNSREIFRLTCQMAQDAGADCAALYDRLMIKGLAGGKKLPGGIIDTGGDWRIAAAALPLSYISADPISVSYAQTMDEAFPGFWQHFADYGGNADIIKTTE
ncbi:MAG: hypothetical protein K5629_02980 [Eubacteriales bacterium]|nr:hypothetical protein [Eubacteriales bacterium]